MMRTANPALTADSFRAVGRVPGARAMTVQGTVNKTGLCLLILVAAASFTWGRAFAGQPVQGWLLGGAFGGAAAALATILRKTWAPVTAPLYAALEGLFLGALSATFEARYPGIVINAVGLTFATLAALLMAYTSRLIPVTQNLRLGIAAATGAIGLFYLASLLLGLFGVRIPFLHEGGPVGVAFSVFVVAVAAFNLVLDFDFIEHGADQGAPGFMEWYAAFGLLVTLIWLYIEILRLLVKLQGGRRERR